MPAQVRIEYTYNRAAAREVANGVCLDLVTDYGTDALAFITLATPVDTGRLRAGNQLIVEGAADFQARALLVNDTSYALDVHDGTPPHVIVPVRAQALRFDIGGETVFATRVNHPGTAGRPFMAEGAARAALEHDFIYTDE